MDFWKMLLGTAREHPDDTRTLTCVIPVRMDLRQEQGAEMKLRLNFASRNNLQELRQTHQLDCQSVFRLEIQNTISGLNKKRMYPVLCLEATPSGFTTSGGYPALPGSATPPGNSQARVSSANRNWRTMGRRAEW